MLMKTETVWIRCAVYGNKTRSQMSKDTELKNYPLLCLNANRQLSLKQRICE